MSKRSCSILALSISAAVLSGCGGAAEGTGPAPGAAANTGATANTGAAAAKDKRHRFEAVKADCMKQKGFTYVPHIRPAGPENEEERRRDSGDYRAMREYRAKYGFGVFSTHVYPDETGAPGAGPGDTADPNAKTQASLSPAQLTAYRKAKDACVAEAGKQVLGLTLKSNLDYLGQLAKAHKRARADRLDGDPELVELAGSMATCLKGKGYRVTDTRPTAIVRRGEIAFMVQQSRLGREQNPDQAGGPKLTEETVESVRPTLTPEEARPYLDKEIKAALDDLECGKDFYAAFAPKKTELQHRINDQYAF
ncbi:hypothetical protein GCM10010466_33960 [Planomonospora alba]|uniref:Uncharacterized protein n=1 Tax=Planomonospora alba TaxID=161354 RepID=A0ABP6N8X6_9ACTN